MNSTASSLYEFLCPISQVKSYAALVESDAAQLCRCDWRSCPTPPREAGCRQMLYAPCSPEDLRGGGISGASVGTGGDLPSGS